MRAIDTNLVVRLIARDDEGQRLTARALIAEGDILLLPTVVLEAEWVLRSRFRMARGRIADALIALCGQPGVTAAQTNAVSAALSAYADAGDFADLLHAALAAEAGARTIAAFDRGFAAPAGLALAVERL